MQLTAERRRADGGTRQEGRSSGDSLSPRLGLGHKDEPEIADALHECDELAVRAAQVLRGKTLHICMQLVMASAGHLLSLVDGPRSMRERARKSWR